MSKSTAHKCTSPTDSAGVGPSNTSVWPGSSCKATKRVWRRVMQTSSTYGTHTYACFKRFLTSSSNTQFWPHLTYLHIRWTTTKLPGDKEMGNKKHSGQYLEFLGDFAVFVCGSLAIDVGARPDSHDYLVPISGLDVGWNGCYTTVAAGT